MERMTRWNPETEEAECEIDGVVHTGSITTRLAEYEDSGLEPEECAKYAQAEKEGRLLVLPCGDDVTPIKCTGLNCPMQVGKVDPATCKAADTCEWATKPLTNADRIRAMSDQELARMFLLHDDHVYRHCPSDTWAEYCQVKPASECCDCDKCWLAYLKQEVKDNA